MKNICRASAWFQRRRLAAHQNSCPMVKPANGKGEGRGGRSHQIHAVASPSWHHAVPCQNAILQLKSPFIKTSFPHRHSQRRRRRSTWHARTRAHGVWMKKNKCRRVSKRPPTTATLSTHNQVQHSHWAYAGHITKTPHTQRTRLYIFVPIVTTAPPLPPVGRAGDTNVLVDENSLVRIPAQDTARFYIFMLYFLLGSRRARDRGYNSFRKNPMKSRRTAGGGCRTQFMHDKNKRPTRGRLLIERYRQGV